MSRFKKALFLLYTFLQPTARNSSPYITNPLLTPNNPPIPKTETGISVRNPKFQEKSSNIFSAVKSGLAKGFDKTNLLFNSLASGDYHAKEHGADITKKINGVEFNALYIAAQEGHDKVVENLLEHGADIEK
ncbi:MAG: hypothetical protein ACO2XZ_04510 [Rickettsiales bacterium]